MQKWQAISKTYCKGGITIYSRSYGTSEDVRVRQPIAVPPNYNGNMYPHEAEKTSAIPDEAKTIPSVKIIPEKKPQAIPTNKEHKKQDGLFSGLFDGLSIDDLVLFGLLLVLLLGDGQDSATVLAVVFVMLLT